MMSVAPMPFKNKIAVQAPQAFSLSLSGNVALQAPQKMIADAYLWDGAPSNKIKSVGSFYPYYTGPNNSAVLAGRLAAAYPINQKFNGHTPVERRPVATVKTRSPMSWKGVWGGTAGGP